MTEPYHYYYNRIPKPSGYLHYWYTNSDADKDITFLLHQNAQQLILPQLNRYRAQVQQLQTKLFSMTSSSADREKMMQLFDLSLYDQEALKNILAPQLNDDDPEPKFTFQDIKDAQNQLSALRKSTDAINQKFPKFCETVTNLVNMFDPTGAGKENLKAVQDDLWEDWKKQAIKNKYITASSANEESQTKVARAIIKNILDKSNKDQIFTDTTTNKKLSTTQITSSVKKMLLLARSLETLNAAGKTSMQLGKVNLRHGTSSDYTTITKENEILKELIGKVFGFISGTKGQVAEDAFAYGYLKSHLDHIGEFEGLTVKPKNMGSDSFKVMTNVNDNKSLMRALKEVKRSMSQYQKQTSKADGGIQFTQNGVEAYIGFSIKAGDKLNINGYNGSASVTLQEGTSLMMLLAREMGLSSKQYQDVLQLLVGHEGQYSGSEIALEWKWEQLKDKLVQLAFVDALTGSTKDGKAHFMVIGGSLYSMERIILDMISGDNLSLAMSKAINKDKNGADQGSLQRSDYLRLNNWSGSRTANESDALSRSDQAWSAASNLLFQTKINISMNMASMSAFKNLAGI